MPWIVTMPNSVHYYQVGEIEFSSDSYDMSTLSESLFTHTPKVTLREVISRRVSDDQPVEVYPFITFGASEVDYSVSWRAQG